MLFGWWGAAEAAASHRRVDPLASGPDAWRDRCPSNVFLVSQALERTRKQRMHRGCHRGDSHRRFDETLHCIPPDFRAISYKAMIDILRASAGDIAEISV